MSESPSTPRVGNDSGARYVKVIQPSIREAHAAAKRARPKYATATADAQTDKTPIATPEHRLEYFDDFECPDWITDQYGHSCPLSNPPSPASKRRAYTEAPVVSSSV